MFGGSLPSSCGFLCGSFLLLGICSQDFFKDFISGDILGIKGKTRFACPVSLVFHGRWGARIICSRFAIADLKLTKRPKWENAFFLHFILVLSFAVAMNGSGLT